MSVSFGRVVGNVDAIAELRAGLAAADEAGTGAMIDIIGQPGSGKSELLRGVLTELGDRPVLRVPGYYAHRPDDASSILEGGRSMVGSYREPDTVSGFIRANPDGVVVIDEAEKVDPGVLERATAHLRHGVLPSREFGVRDSARATIIRLSRDDLPQGADDALVMPELINRGLQAQRPIVRVATEPVTPAMVEPIAERMIDDALERTNSVFRGAIAAGMPDPATIAARIDPEQLAQSGARTIERAVGEARQSAIDDLVDAIEPYPVRT